MWKKKGYYVFIHCLDGEEATFSTLRVMIIHLPLSFLCLGAAVHPFDVVNCPKRKKNP